MAKTYKTSPYRAKLTAAIADGTALEYHDHTRGTCDLAEFTPGKSVHRWPGRCRYELSENRHAGVYWGSGWGQPRGLKIGVRKFHRAKRRSAKVDLTKAASTGDKYTDHLGVFGGSQDYDGPAPLRTRHSAQWDLW